MAEAPWLTIIGLGKDGPDGLSPASREALAQAEIVMGPPRHLALLPNLTATRLEWPVPFADGLPQLMELRGQKVVVLVSGDPFWHGAGSVIARHLESGEWRAIPGVSSFSLAAARLGWRLEETVCLGLHAAPLSRLRSHLAPGVRLIVLLRDGAAVADLAAYLCETGFASTKMTVMESLAGDNERMTLAQADALPNIAFAHPLCVALEVAGDGATVSTGSGIDDALFDNDGQITKRPVRALTMSALAPKPHERLWDIGGGSGSIAIEWLLSHPTTQAVSIEQQPDRAARIRTNADRLGVDRLQVVTGMAPAALDGLPAPNAVFVGGGATAELFGDLERRLANGTRLVANAVTLETEALLAEWQDRLGGTLTRIELAAAEPLGTRRGWRTAYPVVQWSVTL